MNIELFVIIWLLRILTWNFVARILIWLLSLVDNVLYGWLLYVRLEYENWIFIAGSEDLNVWSILVFDFFCSCLFSNYWFCGFQWMLGLLISKLHLGSCALMWYGEQVNKFLFGLLSLRLCNFRSQITEKLRSVSDLRIGSQFHWGFGSDHQIFWENSTCNRPKTPNFSRILENYVWITGFSDWVRWIGYCCTALVLVVTLCGSVCYECASCGVLRLAMLV